MIGLQSQLLKVGKIVFFFWRDFYDPPFSAAIWWILELYCCIKGVLFRLEKKGHNSTNECKLIITAIKQHCVFYDDDALLLKIFKKEIDLIPDHMDGPCPSITASFLRDSRPTGSSSRSAQATSAWIFWASRIRKPHLPSNHKMCVVR